MPFHSQTLIAVSFLRRFFFSRPWLFSAKPLANARGTDLRRWLVSAVFLIAALSLGMGVFLSRSSAFVQSQPLRPSFPL